MLTYAAEPKILEINLPRQQGAVLGIVLLLLFVLTLIGVQALESSLLETKMSNNMQAIDVSFQGAEAALREGEASVSNEFVKGCSYEQQAVDYYLHKPASWWYSESTCNNYHQDVDTRFVIEKIATDPCAKTESYSGVDYYRITARATMKEHAIPVVLQSTIVAPTPDLTECTSKFHLVHAGRQSWRQLA